MMTAEIIALIVAGGVECGKAALMAYLENQRIQGKTKEEIQAHIKEVADVYFALPDPAAILEELKKTLAAQEAEKVLFLKK